MAPLVSNPKTVASSWTPGVHEAPFFVRSAVSAVMQGEIQAVSADQGRDTDCNGSVPNLSNMMDDSTLDTTTAPGEMDIGDRGEPKSHSAQAACLRPFGVQKVPLPMPHIHPSFAWATLSGGDQDEDHLQPAPRAFKEPA